MGGSSTVDPNKYLPAYQSSSPNFAGWSNLMGSTGTIADANLMHMADSPPEVRIADIPGLQGIVAREAEINALKSRALDEKLNPEVAQARQLAKERILADASEGPNKELSNIWTKLALSDAIATGAGTDGGFARSAIADSTRRDYIGDRDRRTDRLLMLAEANPEIVAGLDPSVLAGMQASAREANSTNREAYQLNNRMATSQRVSDLNSQFQQMLQAYAQQSQFDTAQRNALAQARLSAAMGQANANMGSSNALTGSLAGAGGAVAAAGLTALIAA